MEKEVLLDLATETVRRYGSLPPDFAEKMAKRIRRKFAVKIEPGEINNLAHHYKEIYTFGAAILKDYLSPPKGKYATPGDVDFDKFLNALIKKFPDDDLDILSKISGYVIYYEYLR
jgi:hypothetical protein